MLLLALFGMPDKGQLASSRWKTRCSKSAGVAQLLTLVRAFNTKSEANEAGFH